MNRAHLVYLRCIRSQVLRCPDRHSPWEPLAPPESSKKHEAIDSFELSLCLVIFFENCWAMCATDEVYSLN